DSSSSAVQTLTGTRDCRTCRTGMSRSYRAASFRVAAKFLRKARLLSRRQEILDPNQERDLRPLDVLLEGQDAVDLRQDPSFVDGLLLQEAPELLGLSLKLELEIEELALRLVNLVANALSLGIVETDL